MANQYHDSNSILPVFVDASGDAYYQQSLVSHHLGMGNKCIRRRLPGRLATPEEIPILKTLGMKACSFHGRICIKLIRADAVNDFLARRREMKKCSPLKKFERRQGPKTVAHTRKKLNACPPRNLPVKKEVKVKEPPPFSIIQLISQALLSSMNKGLTAREITNWMSETQPHYQHLSNKLLSKVGHKLSESRFFEHSVGRPCQWYIVGEYEAWLRKTAFVPKSNVQSSPNLTVNRMKEPPFTIVKLVGQALLGSGNSGLTLGEIKAWIVEAYPYYQRADNCLKRISGALHSSKFFVKQSKSSGLWLIVNKYEACLRKIAYLPDTERRTERPRVDRRTSEGSLLPVTIFVDEASETTEESPDEVPILTENLLDNKCLVSYLEIDDDMQTFAKQEYRHIRAESSSSSIAVKQEQQRLALTVTAASSSQEMKPGMSDVINLVDDQPTNPTDELVCEVDPIAFPILVDTIDLTGGEIDLRCPICDTQFRTKEALGEHVVTHRKAQSNDATKTASEAIQNMASSLFGNSSGEAFQKMTSSLLGSNRTEAPIFVFSGNNVYFTTPSTPTTS